MRDAGNGRDPVHPFDPDDPGDADLEAGLDREFPLGDGTADTDATVVCPWCAEPVTIALDPGGGAEQEYVEDCQVCCQPWQVHVVWRGDGRADVTTTPLE
jgi:hypothetical protein